MNPKILLVDTNYPINSRNQRLVNSLIKHFGKENVGFIAWNRQNTDVSKNDNQFVFNAFSPLGNRMEKLKHLKAYSDFINNIVDTFEPTVIIASHWDSLIICRKYEKNGIKVIYENIDMPSGNKFVRTILRLIERWSLRNVTAISHASRFFKRHYMWFKGKQIVVENLPVIPHSQPTTQPFKGDSDTLKIIFNGGLRYAQTMIRLMSAIGNMPGIRLDIYGDAVGKEGESIISFGNQFSNIIFHGKYKYEEICSIMDNADIIWAVYPSSDFNVKYAISNKFHESLYYKVPGIYSKDTSLGNLVLHNGIGFVVDESSITNIKDCIKKIRDSKKCTLEEVAKNIAEYRKNQPCCWDDVYRYFNKLIENLHIH